MTSIDIKTATTAELLAFFNQHSGREPVARFSDRKTAEKRVQLLLDRPGMDGDSADAPAPAPAVEASAEPVKAKKVAKADKPVKQPKAKGAGPDPKRAAAISASWQNAKTRKARIARNACKVKGEVYASVPKAFAALKLDMKKMQRVRREMVVNGHTTFEGIRFTLTTVE